MLTYLLSGALANHDAKRLYDDLLKKSNYNRLIRPVQNSNETLEVKLGLKLSQLADVVSKTDRCQCVCACVCVLAGMAELQGLTEEN